MNMLELAAGTYPVPHAGLVYDLPRDLRLPPGSCLLLQGENGAGKSTFLEHVLIPELRKGHRLAYLAQDMELQRNTVTATLALLGHEVPRSLADMAAAWVDVCGHRDVIILDEFDKYLDDDQLAALGLSRFSWAVMVSHLERRETGLASGFALRFSRPCPDGPDVHVDQERLWPA